MFPSTKAIELCNRVENPLSNGGLWGGIITSGDDRLQCDGTELVCQTEGTYSSAYWAPSAVGVGYYDQEIWMDIPAIAMSNLYFMYVRIQPGSLAGAPNCYDVRFNGTDNTVAIANQVAGVENFLADVPVTITGGGRFGIRMVGTTIVAYYNGVDVADAQDNTWASGAFGLATSEINNGGPTLVGGGVFKASTPIVNKHFRPQIYAPGLAR